MKFKLSEKNKEAIKSSLLVGVSFGLFWYGLVSYAWSDHVSAGLVGGVMFVVGLLFGLATTWYTDE